MILMRMTRDHVFDYLYGNGVVSKSWVYYTILGRTKKLLRLYQPIEAVMLSQPQIESDDLRM